MIELHGLTKRYGKAVGVEEVTFTVREGEIFGLLGPNGAGKTTTLRMMATLLAPTAGQGTIAAHKLGEEDREIRSVLGYLPETPGLYDRLTADENLVYFGRLYGLSHSEAARRGEELLQSFGLLERRGEKVGGYSKGMKQKLALARALLHRPRVLLLDEPTSGLDPEASADFRQRIRALRSEGRAIVLSTHRLEEAEAVCDSVGIVKTRLLAVRRLSELRETSGALSVAVRLAAAQESALSRAATVPGVRGRREESGRTIYEVESESVCPPLVRALVEAGADVISVEPVRVRLEDVYLSLVGARNGDGTISAAPVAGGR